MLWGRSYRNKKLFMYLSRLFTVKNVTGVNTCPQFRAREQGQGQEAQTALFWALTVRKSYITLALCSSKWSSHEAGISQLQPLTDCFCTACKLKMVFILLYSWKASNNSFMTCKNYIKSNFLPYPKIFWDRATHSFTYHLWNKP